MNGREFRVKVPIFPDPHATIVSSRIYPSGEDTIVAFDVDGTVKGTVYIRTRIWYDAIRKVVRLEWWDFTLDTRSELLRNATWLYFALVDPTVGGLLQQGIAIDMKPHLARLDSDLEAALNRPLGPNAELHSQLQPVDLVGLFSTTTDLVVVSRLTGKVDIAVHRGEIPRGDEVRTISVMFITEDDDKDPDDEVMIQLLRAGVPPQERWFFKNRQVADHQAAGPYGFIVPPGAKRGQCGQDVLRIYKRPPDGQETGSGWNTAIIVKAFYADGQEREVLHRDYVRIGDNNPFDLRFPLCW